MIRQFKIRIYTLSVFMFLSTWSYTQETDSGTRYAEEEIQIQDLYIRANQKKILQKYDEALEIYIQIIKKNEVSPAVHHDMARIYQAMDKKDLAIASALKSTRYEPDNPWYLMTLTQMYEDAIEPLKAAQAIAKVIKLSPSEDLYNRWAINLEHAGQKEQAISAYNQADSQYGWSIARSDSKVDLYLSLKKEKEALKEISKWTQQYPDDIDAWIRLARYHEYRGSKKKSQKAYTQVLAIDPNNEEALYKSQEEQLTAGDSPELARFIGDSRIQLDKKIAAILPQLENDPKTVLSYCKSLIDQYPKEAKVYALYGDAYWLSGDASNAVTQYQSSLNHSKAVYQVWDQLMLALQDQQDFDELNRTAEEAIDYYPNQAGPYYYQAVALFNLGELGAATEANEEASFIAGQDAPIHEFISILAAQILATEGKFSEAIEQLEKTKDASAGMLELLGDLYMQTGNKPKAADAWRKALSKGGVSNRISAKIDSL